jgi:hypothetical protein
VQIERRPQPVQRATVSRSFGLPSSCGRRSAAGIALRTVCAIVLQFRCTADTNAKLKAGDILIGYVTADTIQQ